MKAFTGERYWLGHYDSLGENTGIRKGEPSLPMRQLGMVVL